MITLAMLSLLVTSFRIKLLRTDQISAYLFGDRVVTASNIPNSFDGISFWNGYSIVIPQYYRLPNVNVKGKTVADIFLSLTELPYVKDQLNPNLIFSKGGNCQAFSIYLRTALEAMGIRSGFFPFPDHVAVWAVIDNVLYRIDITTREFSRVSYRDRAYLLSHVEELRYTE